jgi:hypothetical protein
MDWNLEKKSKEKAKLFKAVSDKNLNMMVAMEREFAQIFGADSDVSFSGKRGKPGDPVRRSELTKDKKNSGA